MSAEPQQPTPLLDPENPWPGLNSYDEAAAPYFNGRDREIADLERMIMRAPMTVVFGKSGLGKSSLIRAGLFPILRAARMLPVYIRFEFSPALGPPTPLVEQLAGAFEAEQLRNRADAPVRPPGQSFWDYLHREDFRVWSAETQPLTPVFVLDQFEEVITLGSVYPELVATWREDLADLAENRIPVATARALSELRTREARAETERPTSIALALKRQDYRVLLSFREDFATIFERWEELPSLMRNRFRLNPMTGTQAFEAIRRSGGHLVDATAAEEIVRFVGSQADPPRAAQDAAVVAAVVAPRPGEDKPLVEISIEPAFLSLVCRGLNERRKSAGKAVIESESLRQTGRGLIDQYYDECMDKQPESVHRFIEEELITETGQRKSCAADDAARPPYYIKFEDLDALVEGRLLRRLPSAQVSSVELVHDLLTPTVLARRNRRRGDPAQYQMALRRARRSEVRPAKTPDAARLLRCTVVNADLSFEGVPLLVGHYESSRLTGTEQTANYLLNGAMSESLGLGIYPTSPGLSHTFANTYPRLDNPLATPLPPRVIVVGLGAEGHLRSVDLKMSVRQAVIGLLQQYGESRPYENVSIVIASTLMGSGGAGVSPGNAAEWIAQGVHEANEVMATTSRGRRISELRLVERYSDRAEQAWRSLRTLATAHPDAFVAAEIIEEGTNSLERPLDFGYRGTDTDLLRVRSANDGSDSRIEYAFYSAGQSEGVEARSTVNAVINDLVERASNAHHPTPGIGETLYALLIPTEIETLFESATTVRLELDAGTAGLPWELLERKSSVDEGRAPWAIRTKAVRNLRLLAGHVTVARSLEATSALIVGEPRTPPEYPRLIGAQAEAHEVERVLAKVLAPTDMLKLTARDFASEAPDATMVLNALFQRPWRIMHLAGQCLPASDGGASGLLLSNGTMLGPRELQALREVPEFVFLNGCYGAPEGEKALLDPQYNRAAFAAQIGEALTRIGVRVVIVAGWLVEDVAAHVFVRTMYAGLLGGLRLADAVAEARNVSYQLGGETWGAFQCYGDSDWFLTGLPVNERPRAATTRVTNVASAKILMLQLKTIVTRLRFDGASPTVELETIATMEAAHGVRWGASGAVAEAFADAYLAVDNLDKAIAWYERAVAAPDGRASLRAIEQLGNLKVRAAWQSVEASLGRPRHHSGSPPTKRGASETSLAPTAHDRSETIQAARAKIAEAVSLYESVLALQPTAPREASYGAAMKRLARIEIAAGREAAASEAVDRMATHYRRACALSDTSLFGDFFFFGLNVIKAEVWLSGQRTKNGRLSPDIVNDTRRSLESSIATEPTFWNVVGLTELRLYVALASGRLAVTHEGLMADFSDLRARMIQPRFWSSVLDEAVFVLGPFVRSSRRTGERQAALKLLDLLEQFATAPQLEPQPPASPQAYPGSDA